MRNIVGKKLARQQDVDSDYLFGKFLGLLIQRFASDHLLLAQLWLRYLRGPSRSYSDAGALGSGDYTGTASPQ
jgi:hypothetical protein